MLSASVHIMISVFFCFIFSIILSCLVLSSLSSSLLSLCLLSLFFLCLCLCHSVMWCVSLCVVVWLCVCVVCVVWCGVVCLCVARLGTRKNPPCVGSTRPRVYIQYVSVYAGTTRTCWNTCARDAGIHGDVLNAHTEACWMDTRVGHHQFCLPRKAHEEFTLGPTSSPKKQKNLTHSTFEKRSRTTCSRFFRWFALPGKVAQLQVSEGKRLKEPAVRLFGLSFAPMKKVQRTICALVSLEASTRVSPDFCPSHGAFTIFPVTTILSYSNHFLDHGIYTHTQTQSHTHTHIHLHIFIYTAPDNTQKQKRETQRNWTAREMRKDDVNGRVVRTVTLKKRKSSDQHWHKKKHCTAIDMVDEQRQ